MLTRLVGLMVWFAPVGHYVVDAFLVSYSVVFGSIAMGVQSIDHQLVSDRLNGLTWDLEVYCTSS